MIQILLALSDKPEVYRGQLYSALSTGSKTVADKITKLKRLGLVSERIEGKKPIRRYLSLTQRGREVAYHFLAAEMIVRRLSTGEMDNSQGDYSSESTQDPSQ